jgi:hypothetical protein
VRDLRVDGIALDRQHDRSRFVVKSGTPLRFRGTPLSVFGMLDGDDLDQHEPIVRLSARAGLSTIADVPTVKVTEGQVPILRLHLPRHTPPGSYEATIGSGKNERPALITVEPEVFLRMFPDRLTLSAKPGDRVPIDLVLANFGNVPVTIQGAYAFGMFDVAGVERAVGRMLTSDEKKGDRRLDVFAEAVAEEHGGLVRVKVESGEGDLAPGEQRELRVLLYVPDHIREGHTYWGTWPIYYLRYYVRITGDSGKAAV